MRKMWLLLALFCIVSCGLVSAVPIRALFVLDCRVSSAEANCSQFVNISCHVIDNVSSISNINSVTFVITEGGIDKTVLGSLRSGTTQDGIWAYVYITAPIGVNNYSVYLKSVAAVSSSGIVCSALNNKQGPEGTGYCYMNFSSQRTCAVACSCTSIFGQEDCSIWNTKDVSAGYYQDVCGGYSTGTVSCDYCDPLWTAVIGSCTYQSNATLAGWAYKTYTSGIGSFPNGGYCCDETKEAAGQMFYNHQGGSDCEAPPDNTNLVSCKTQDWLRYGGDSWATNYNYWSYAESTLSDTTLLSYSVGQDRYMQPLIFDMDFDGAAEVFLVNSNKLYAVSVSGGSLADESTFTTSGYTHIGQAAIWGVYKEPETGVFYCVEDQGYLPCSDMGIITAASDNSIKVYRYVGGSFVLNNSIPTYSILGANTALTCHANKNDPYCYFTSKDGYVFKLDVLSPATPLVSTFVSPYNDTEDHIRMPIIDDVDFDGQSDVLFYTVEDINGTNTVFTVTDLGLSILDTKSISADVIGVMVLDRLVYYTAISDTGSYIIGKINFATGATQVSTVYSGGLGQCLSPPVAVNCIGTGELDVGVAYYSDYVPPPAPSEDEWVQWTPSPTTDQLIKVWAFDNGRAMAVNSAYNKWFLFTGTQWKQVAGPDPLVVGYVLHACDKTRSGDQDRLICMYLNTNYNARWVEYTPSEEYWFIKTDVYGNPRELNFGMVCPYDESSDCFVTNFNGTLWKVTDSGLTSYGNDTVSIQGRLFPSNEKIMYGISGTTFRLWEWGGVSWINRANIASLGAVASSSRHIYESSSERALFLDFASTYDRIYWFNATTGLFGYVSGQSLSAYITSIENIGGDLWVSKTIKSLDRYEFGNNNASESFATVLAMRWMDYNEISGTGWAVGDGGIIYRYAGTGGGAASEVSSLKCMDSGGLGAKKTIALPETDCQVAGGLTSFDINYDGYVEVFSGGGIYSFKTYSNLASTLPNAVVLPIDGNGDGYIDYLISSSGSLRLMVSRITPDSATFGAAEPLVKRLQPRSVDANGLLSLGIWGVSGNPDSTYFELYPDASVNDKVRQNYLGAIQPSNMFSYQYSASGDYVVKGKICDSGVTSPNNVCSEMNCSVEVSIPEVKREACSWGDDGSFNWLKNIRDKGWQLETSDYYVPDGGILRFQGHIGNALSHVAPCDQKVLTVEFKMKASTNSVFEMVLSSGQKTVASIRFEGGNIYKSEGGSSAVVWQYGSNIWTTYKIVADASSGRYSVFINGDSVATIEGEFTETVSDFYSGIINMAYGWGDVDVDYVVYWGSGGQKIVVEPGIEEELFKECNAEISKLYACNPNLNVSYLDAVRNNSRNKAYPNLDTVCAGCKNGYCSYTQLNKILAINNDCMKEAMNYCVDVTYPRQTLRKGSGLSGDDSPNEGMAVCSFTLGSSTIMSKTLFPVVNVGWGVVKSYLWPAMLFIVILVIAWAAKGSKK